MRPALVRHAGVDPCSARSRCSQPFRSFSVPACAARNSRRSRPVCTSWPNWRSSD